MEDQDVALRRPKISVVVPGVNNRRARLAGENVLQQLILGVDVDSPGDVPTGKLVREAVRNKNKKDKGI